jgi:putative ABC transport system permease protein
MSNAFRLAFKYLLSAPFRTLILIFGLSIALYLPIFSYSAAALLNDLLLERGESSPILLGHKGNEFDLTMNALYFRGEVKDPIPMLEALAVTEKEYGGAVPLYNKHSASGAPLVGTSLDYFQYRDLKIKSGRTFAVLGEIVVGASLVSDYGFKVGDTIRSDSKNLYNIAGPYPMMLTIVGSLEESNSPDDHAIFADVKTTWTLDGFFHGHEDVTRQNSLNSEDEDAENLEATAAIFMFQEFDEKSVRSFHMHGELESLPLSSVMVFPSSQRAHDQLLGDYALSDNLQAVRPSQVIETILGIVLRLQEGLNVYFIVILLATVALMVLIFQLSYRLRASEFRLIKRMGASRNTIGKLIMAELLILLCSSSLISGMISWASLSFLAKILS